MSRTTDSPKRRLPIQRQSESPLDSGPNRQRAFEERLLEIKLANPHERVALACSMAQNEGLNIAERRQLLIAIQRYVLAHPGDLPTDLGQVLAAVAQLATRSDLRLKGLELFRSALDVLKRSLVLEQLKPHLEQLLRHFLPTSARAEFAPELFLRIARKLEEQRETEAIVNLATLGLFFFPFNGPLREMRADYFFILGNTGGARADYDRLVDLFPDRLEYRLDRADSASRLDDIESALEDLAYYLRAFPDDPPALRRHAEALSHLGRHLDALGVLKRLVELEPANSENYISRAHVHEQLDMIEEALADVDKVLQLEPANQEARQLKHSLILRRQSYGMEDDVYTSFARGDEDTFIGETKIPETRFADIGGLDQVKQLIRETIEYPLKYREISERYGKKAGGGLLFFGPPGCGKTLLARAAAGECSARFINVNLASVLDKWVGNSEKAVSMIFTAARKHAPSIIFLDEVDAIGGNRANLQAGWEKKLISQLLIELDGLTSSNENVMVLGASNAPWEVDFALRRPGRLGRLVFVPPPDEKARAAIFEIYLSRKPMIEPGIDLEALTTATPHHSADAIRQIVENAASIPWRNAIETGELQPITAEHLRTAIEQTPPDLTEWEKMVSRYQEFARQSLTKHSIGFRKQTTPRK